MEVLGQELCGRYNCGGKERGEEETFESNSDVGDVLVGDEVEHKVEGGGGSEVDLEGAVVRKAWSDKGGLEVR